jgi:hypothetical protein
MLPRRSSCRRLDSVDRLVTLTEHPSEDGAGVVLGRQQDAVSGPREAAIRLLDIDPEVESTECASAWPICSAAQLIE